MELWPWRQSSISENIESFDSIQADLADGDIVIEGGSEYKITGRNVKDNQIDWYVENGSLVIEEDSFRSWFSNFNRRERTIIVTIPREAAFENIEITAGDSDISINNLHGENLEIDSNDGQVMVQQTTAERIGIVMGDGDIHLDDLEAETIEIDSDDGDLYFNQLQANSLISNIGDGDMVMDGCDIKNLQHDGESSNLTVGNSKLVESLISLSDGDFSGNQLTLTQFNLESDDGEVFLEIDGARKDYGLILDSDDGDILVDEQVYREKDEQKDNVVTISSGDGDILIKFLK